MEISQIVQKIKPSATIAAAGKAKELKSRGVEVLEFTLGEPDFNTPDHICEAAIAAKSGITKAEFAIFTPYPGTPAWTRLEREGRIFDRTWSRYNDANCVFLPKNLTPDQLTEGYLRLWREFYAGKDFSTHTVAERTIQF